MNNMWLYGGIDLSDSVVNSVVVSDNDGFIFSVIVLSSDISGVIDSKTPAI